jgi:aminopeptidase
MSYQPRQEIVDRYANLLVNYALGGGAGIKPGSVVQVRGAEDAKPLFIEVCRAVWRAGGHVIQHYEPAEDAGSSLQRIFFEEASEEQLDFFPAAQQRGLVDQLDHLVYLFAQRDPQVLRDVDPQKQMRRQQAWRDAIEWEQEKEAAGKFDWTIGMWGTEAMAAEARMSLEEYWQQIVKACFLEDSDPIARWRETGDQIDRFRDWLNSLPIDRLHVEGEDVDLWLTIGEKRLWLGGSGRNIPSFEIFTCPDWRGTEGRIRFSEPLYSYGSLIKGVALTFEGGRVVRATADENEQLLAQIVAADNGDKVGEFSLTDARLSPIDRFMASTLFDENTGGPYGNTHLALGLSFPNAYDGDPTGLSPEDWEALGFNQAAVHEDIVSTTDRTVTATLRDGSELLIYADGRFQLDT